MKVEGFKFFLYFAFTIVISLALLNTLVFYELKRFVELSIYEQAYAHYIAHTLSGGVYKGNENFSVSESYTENSLSYVFKDPTNPDKYIYVSVKPNYAKSMIEGFFKNLLIMEFVVVFVFLLVFQFIIDKTFGKLKEQEEWTKSLVASVAHKLGNFLSVQKVNLAILKTKLKDEKALNRLEKSLSKVEKDMNLILHLLREEKQMKREWIRVDKLILEMLEEFGEDLQGKKVIFRPVETY
ncbi:MAG: sensor histidine kinase, partial [Hydrogenobacter sp.]